MGPDYYGMMVPRNSTFCSTIEFVTGGASQQRKDPISFAFTKKKIVADLGQGVDSSSSG